jgi:protocatechuate 3,4-dioxygenase beta subunit
MLVRMIVRTFLASVTLLASALPLQAQGGKAQDKPHAPCRVSGRVVSALDGAALKSSRVTLIQEGVKSHPKVFGTTTDSDGLFEIKNVTAGRYNFIASHVGYVDRQYQAQGTDQGAVLSLQPGEDFHDALFRLIRAGVIAGRILDENGEPMANVAVSALRKPTATEKEEEGPRHSHKEELITSTGVLTDDRGEYRLFGLKPGDYYVKASESNEFLLSFFTQDAETQRMVQEALGSEYVPLYYPGVVAFDQAQTVGVRAGEEIEADFNMRHVLAVEIAGKVIGPDGRPSSHAMLDLEQAGVDDNSFGEFTTNTDNNGEFSLKNVPPGSYVLTANEYEDQKFWRARQKIEVGERKIDSIVLALGRGNTISGHVTFSGRASTSDPSRVFLSLTPAGDSDDANGGWAMVKKEGTFEFLDVPDGTYAIEINCRDSAWFPKSVRFGPEDVLEKGLQVEKGSTGGTLEIVMSSSSAQLEGAVTQKDKPAVAAQVRIHPDPETPFNHLRAKSTTTDQNGHFSILNLAPGKYKVTAKLETDAAAPAATAEAQTLTLHEGDHQSVQLTLEEPSGVERTSTRPGAEYALRERSGLVHQIHHGRDGAAHSGASLHGGHVRVRS